MEKYELLVTTKEKGGVQGFFFQATRKKSDLKEIPWETTLNWLAVHMFW